MNKLKWIITVRPKKVSGLYIKELCKDDDGFPYPLLTNQYEKSMRFNESDALNLADDLNDDAGDEFSFMPVSRPFKIDNGDSFTVLDLHDDDIDDIINLLSDIRELYVTKKRYKEMDLTAENYPKLNEFRNDVLKTIDKSITDKVDNLKSYGINFTTEPK